MNERKLPETEYEARIHEAIKWRAQVERGSFPSAEQDGHPPRRAQVGAEALQLTRSLVDCEKTGCEPALSLLNKAVIFDGVIHGGLDLNDVKKSTPDVLDRACRFALELSKTSGKPLPLDCTDHCHFKSNTP